MKFPRWEKLQASKDWSFSTSIYLHKRERCICTYFTYIHACRHLHTHTHRFTPWICMVLGGLQVSPGWVGLTSWRGPSATCANPVPDSTSSATWKTAEDSFSKAIAGSSMALWYATTTSCTECRETTLQPKPMSSLAHTQPSLASRTCWVPHCNVTGEEILRLLH